MIGRRPPASCSLLPDVYWPLQPGQLGRGCCATSTPPARSVSALPLPPLVRLIALLGLPGHPTSTSGSMLSESPSTWCWMLFRRAGLARCVCALCAAAVLAGGVTALDASAPPLASYLFVCACRLARYLRRAVVGRRWTRRFRNHRRRRIVTTWILCDFQNARVY